MHGPPELPGQEAPAPAPRTWLVPVLGAVVQLVTGLLLLRVGIHYDDQHRAPGALTWVAVSLLAAPWLIYARGQWRRAGLARPGASAPRALPETRIAAELGPLIQKHGITGVFNAIDRVADAAIRQHGGASGTWRAIDQAADDPSRRGGSDVDRR
ncbi:hypothetical protein OV079_00025 [Nannocystis pusilla]|uniref:Uncharacterized protein n=1 Tax=Nannocystis pusilla TaxID=889268 RepID=A0A9X3ERC5_9BACT|nr:hypothetical protein [Nannocystis pusilla]MCY1003978.1 hypothetical protein [Nannocystis pusilla]